MAGEADASAPSSSTPTKESRSTDPDAAVPTRALPRDTAAPKTESISMETIPSEDEAPSSVRPSSPTLPTAKSSSDTPVRPVIVRTTPPPYPVPEGLPASPATTTPTGRDPKSPATTTPALAPQPTPIPAPAATPTAPPISPARSSQRGLVGATLGRYEILEEVGHGGMATVYRAMDPRLERNVALKVIHPHLRDNPEIAQRFRHEARAVAKLKHPAIVEIYDVPDEEGDERFLVAEYVDGPSLRKWLQQTQKEMQKEIPEIANGRAPLMPPEIAAALLLQILAALGRAHQEGIIHRDVKPENILLAGLGVPASSRPSDPNRSLPTAKLTDFGIAKILDAQSMTSTGQILGSPAHMAPEQIEGGDVSPRVDVFATGVLFYELLTGALPFDGKNPAQVIRRVLDGQFTPADRVTPTVGGRWAAIVGGMLARDPEKRPATVEDVCDQIRRELQAIGAEEADKELAAYLRDPVRVMREWGDRVKPKLLDRAVKAREQGDAVGAANDLNRALAYDPSDPKLMRAVTSMRTRERRLQALRRFAPTIVIGAVVVAGTFLGVRKLQETTPITSDGTTTTTSASTSAPPPTPSTPPSTSASIATSVSASVAPSVTTATPPTVPIAHDAAVAPTVHETRMVRFNLSPVGTFSVDGDGPFDPLSSGLRELTVGEHTVTAVGTQGCCDPYSTKIKVVAGEDVQLVDIHLTLKPASVFVANAPDGVQVTITVKDKAGTVLASGIGKASVPMKDTRLSVTITLEANGQSKSIDATLSPGDARYEDFQ